MSKVGSVETKNLLLCSFCGKNQHEVRKLTAGVPDLRVFARPQGHRTSWR
jgi:hypothetical protein